MTLLSRIINIANIHKKEFVLSGLAQLIYMSQSLFQNKIFAVNFETEGFGRWSLLMSIYTLISMLPFTALDQGVYSVANDYRKIGEAKSLFTKVTYTYLLIYAIYIIFALVYVCCCSIPVDVSLTLFMLYTITEVLKNTYTLIDNAYRNRKRVLILRLVDFVFRLSMFLIVAYLGYFTINNVLIILIATNLLAITILHEYLLKFNLELFKDKYTNFYKSVVNFSLPLLVWALFGWLQNMIGRWYLDIHVDESGVALYSMLVSISYFFPYAFYSVVSTYIMPIIYSRDDKCDRKFLYTLLLGCFAVLLIYFLCIVFWGNKLVLLLADTKYIDIVGYLPYTTITSIVYVIAMLSTVEIYRSKNTKKLLFPTILPGLIMSTAGYFLIMKYQLDGAVINYMIGQLLYSIIVLPLGINSTSK